MSRGNEMPLIALLIFTFVAFVPDTARAQWVYQGTESAFGEDTMHVAVTSDGIYGFGFRCKSGNAEAIYITPDRSFDTPTAYEFANATTPKLRIRVDDKPIMDVSARLVDEDGKAVAIAEVELALLESARVAKKRVAVVMELLGENYHERSFSVAGSTKALSKIIAGCVPASR